MEFRGHEYKQCKMFCFTKIRIYPLPRVLTSFLHIILTDNLWLIPISKWFFGDNFVTILVVQRFLITEKIARKKNKKKQETHVIIYVQDQWNYYILFTQEIKGFIVDFSFFIKGSFVHIALPFKVFKNTTIYLFLHDGIAL